MGTSVQFCIINAYLHGRPLKLRQHGIDWRQKGSSHCVFVRADGKTLPVPAHRPIKPIYVKKFVALVRGD
jgi:hypothetical protein